MKKMVYICMLLMNFLLNPAYCYAAEEIPYVYNGYTEDNVYYEVYIHDLTLENTAKSYTYYVNTDIVYDAILVPDTTIPWTQTVGDARYSGTLTLNSFYYSNGKTIANYRGTLYRVV